MSIKSWGRHRSSWGYKDRKVGQIDFLKYLVPQKLFSGVKLGTIKVRSVIKKKFSVINLKYHFLWHILSEEKKYHCSFSIYSQFLLLLCSILRYITKLIWRIPCLIWHFPRGFHSFFYLTLKVKQKLHKKISMSENNQREKTTFMSRTIHQNFFEKIIDQNLWRVIVNCGFRALKHLIMAII